MVCRNAIVFRRLFDTPKDLELLVRKMFVRFVCEGEMTHQSLYRHCREIAAACEKSGHFIRPNANTTHTGIHFKVHCNPFPDLSCGPPQTLDHVKRADYG